MSAKNTRKLCAQLHRSGLDDRRRLVLPPSFKAKSAVTIQEIDEDTILVKVAKPARHRMVMLLPDVKQMPEDPEWEKVEQEFTVASNQGLTPFEE